MDFNDNNKKEDEESIAISDMVKKIAWLDTDKRDFVSKESDSELSKKENDDSDEEDWSVNTSIDFSKFNILKKIKSVFKNKKTDTEEPKEEITDALKEEPKEAADEVLKETDEVSKEETEEVLKETEEVSKEEKEAEPEYVNEPEQNFSTEHKLSTEQEMLLEVENLMYEGESKEETENRRKKYIDESEDFLPVINISDLGLDNGNEDSIIDGLNINLAEQVSNELNANKRKIMKIIRLSVISFLALFVLFVLFTRPGHKIATRVIAKIIVSKIEKPEPGGQTRLDEQEVINKGDKGDFVPVYTLTPVPTEYALMTPVLTPTPYTDYHPHFEKDDSVINVLLIGVENYENYTYGRSDSMIVASIDKDGGPVKLVSLMRDMYVEIPGYSDNRLNAAFAFGGAELLLETIELNFGLSCDGYVTVDYSGFESIVDYIGGIEISLTQEEADYLNTTNYISDKANRCVTVGKQLLNGNQIMGYCRVRKVPTANGLYMDFGRTYRQRVVLQKIFEEYKSSGFSVLYGAMNECLKYVTCSENLEPVIADCLQLFVDKGISEMDTFRIPASGHYEEIKINGAQVLSIDSENANILHEYLYGEN